MLRSSGPCLAAALALVLAVGPVAGQTPETGEPVPAPEGPHILRDVSVRFDVFAIKGVYGKGVSFGVIAKSGDWYNVRLPDTETGWVHNLNVTLELLPGRQMVPSLTAGAGSTILQGAAEPTTNLGADTRLYLGKKTAMRWEVRNYHFSSGDDPSRRSDSNFEVVLGTSFLL